MSTPAEEVTRQILSAWDEVAETIPGQGTVLSEGEPETPETTEPEEESVGEEEEGAVVEPPAEEETPAPEEEPAEETEPAEGEEPEEEEPEVKADFDSDDPEVRAFLAKYQGDVERALKGGMQMQQALSRQGREKQLLEARVAELDSEVTQLRSFSDSTSILSPEQREWVGQALESGNPTSFVRAAVEAGQFDLARAVCDEWGNEAPYEALRAATAVDQAEQAMAYAAAPEAPPLNRALLLDAIADHYPELPQYAAQMTETMNKLGDEHPLVQESRSDDPDTAIRGVIGIYEIARASTHALASTREKIKEDKREEGDSARRKAVVASGSSAPQPSESARPKRLGPGLTLEQLEEEWERQK